MHPSRSVPQDCMASSLCFSLAQVFKVAIRIKVIKIQDTRVDKTEITLEEVTRVAIIMAVSEAASKVGTKELRNSTPLNTRLRRVVTGSHRALVNRVINASLLMEITS